MQSRRVARAEIMLVVGLTFALLAAAVLALREPRVVAPPVTPGALPTLTRDDVVPGVRPTHPLASGPQPTLPPVPELNPQLVADGRVLYDRHCANCHGVNLRGQPDWRTRQPNGQYPSPPHDDSGHTWHHGDALLYQIIFEGGNGALNATESGMPAFRDALTGREAVSILSYIKSHWSRENLEYQWAMTILAH